MQLSYGRARAVHYYDTGSNHALDMTVEHVFQKEEGEYGGICSIYVT